MYKNFVYSVLTFFLLQSCHKKNDKAFIIVKYTDSTYAQKTDSLRTDSIDESMNGFVKIYRSTNKSSFEKGVLYQGMRIGKWQRFLDGKKLSEVVTYNQQGIKEGSYITFFPNGKKKEEFNFNNGVLLGIQKEYYPNGNLALLYTEDGNNNYVNEYVALQETGDTLYHVNLGTEGTGYLKEYNKEGILEREGKLENKMYQDTVKEYFYNYRLKKYSYIDIYVYQKDTINFIKKLNL